MSTYLNADEAFEVARQIERNGVRFYRAAAERFPDMGPLLLDLADMEDEHEKTFAATQDRFREWDPQDLFDPDDQAGMYLRALAEGKIFDTKADPVVLLGDKKTPQDVLIMAIGLEKDSILYYVGLKATMAKQSDKDKVEAIIAEEIAHIVTLSKKIDALK